MFLKIGFHFIFIFVFSLPVFSAECLLSKALNNSKLSDNQEFWTDYSTLIKKGVTSDEAIKTLAKKYDPEFGHGIRSVTVPTPTPASPKGSLQLDIHKRARGEINRLPAPLKKKVDGLLEVVLRPAGIKELYDNPGKWHFERLAQFGPNAHSVRLNGGYRVLFDIKDGKIIVREVNKGHIHGD